jgi:hypothetical protein
MRRPLVSVAGMMALVIFAAVGIVAVKSPTPAWASAMLTTTVCLLGLATLGGVYSRGEGRPF